MRVSHRRRALAATALILSAAMALTACSGARRATGADRSRPDEFRIVTMAPLEVPPEYNLRPPRPGEPRPQEYSANEQARRALLGGEVETNASSAERMLVSLAGGAEADPAIRATIDAETSGVIRRRRGFANRVLFWRGGDVADEANPLANVSEAERLERIEAGDLATGEGDVVIRRSGGGLKLPGL